MKVETRKVHRGRDEIKDHEAGKAESIVGDRVENGQSPGEVPIHICLVIMMLLFQLRYHFR